LQPIATQGRFHRITSAPKADAMDTHRGRRRSGFTREEAGPAGQSPPAVQRCHHHRIRG